MRGGVGGRLRAGLLAVAVVAAGCGDDDEAGGSTVTVLAAASLAAAFDELAVAFEAGSGIAVEASYAGSSSLREQVLAGAPADVFAAADPSEVDRLVEAGAASDPAVFASNRLQVAVPAGNPGGVTGIGDLARGDLLVGLCAEPVPCGRLAREALAAAGVTPSLDTEEPDVRALRTKLAAGDLDVGIVYRTDVLAAGDDLEGIDLPAAADDVRATYAVATVGGGDAARAEAFVAFLLGREGQAILAAHGFEGP